LVTGANLRSTELINKQTISIGIILVFILSAAATTAKAAQYKTRQIRIQYVLPVSSEYQPIYEHLKQAGALERLQQLLSPFRLPQPLVLKVSGCEGESNAWYENGVITVCYEFLHDILKKAPEQTLPSGVTRDDAILGPFLDVFLHETGHAVFDLLKVPVFGREEDAADMFSAYMMLQLGKDYSHRLMLGSAYQYKVDVENPQVSLEIKKFSNEHGVPAQRFYNVLCIAYGADQKMFADVVQKGYLPESRAEACEGEYDQTAFAFKKLIGPYIDKALAKKVLKTWMRDVEARPRYQPSH
jgi:Putative metallopeptidase